MHCARLRLAAIAFVLGMTTAAYLSADLPEPVGPSADSRLETSSRFVSRTKLADMRAEEAESAATLILLGASLYSSDASKKNGFRYCRAAVAQADLGNFRASIHEASKALFLGMEKQDDYLLAFAKRDLAAAYSFAGDLDNAKRFAEEAVSHMKRVGSRNRQAVLGPAHRILGDVALRTGEVSAALEGYNLSLRHCASDYKPYVLASAASAHQARGELGQARRLLKRALKRVHPDARPVLLRRIGDIDLLEGKPEAALARFEQSVDEAQGAEKAYHRMWALAGIGRARRTAGDIDGAIAAFLEALELADAVRSRFRSEEFKTGFFGDIQDIFSDAVSLLVGAGRDTEAFDLSERSRARGLLDLVRDPAFASHGTHAFADSSAARRSAERVRATLFEQTALVSYHLTDDALYAWILRRGEPVRAVAIPISQTTLTAQARDFRARISELEDVRELSRKLYDTLIRPLDLRPEESLIVVPHGALHYVPFQALSSDEGYLVRERAIYYAPSASTLVTLLDRPAPRRATLLALGNPSLGDEELSLPGSEREVRRIATYFEQADLLVGRDATEEALLERAKGSDVIHIAAHAEVDELDPLQSIIHLADTRRADGKLYAHEIYGLDLRSTSMVTLSACDTARGRISRGDEPWGFSRAFLSAGVSSLTVSLWPVSDTATEALMAAYYEALRDRPAAEALRNAQLTLLNDPVMRAPVFWAAFNLVGDPR